MLPQHRRTPVEPIGRQRLVPMPVPVGPTIRKPQHLRQAGRDHLHQFPLRGQEVEVQLRAPGAEVYLHREPVVEAVAAAM